MNFKTRRPVENRFAGAGILAFVVIPSVFETRMLKKLIYADFPKNNSVAIALNADCRPKRYD